MSRDTKHVVNRAVETEAKEPMADGLVEVEALGHVNEEVNGVSTTFKPGDKFRVTAARAESLVTGKNVKILS